MNSDMRIVGLAVTYAELRALIKKRRIELGLSQLAFDQLAGLPDGYTGKIECGKRHLGEQSFEQVARALGVSVGLMRTSGAHKNNDEKTNSLASYPQEHLKKIAHLGGKKTASILLPHERRAAARAAANARWAKVRLLKKQAKSRAKRSRLKQSDEAE